MNVAEQKYVQSLFCHNISNRGYISIEEGARDISSSNHTTSFSAQYNNLLESIF